MKIFKKTNSSTYVKAYPSDWCSKKPAGSCTAWNLAGQSDAHGKKRLLRDSQGSASPANQLDVSGTDRRGLSLDRNEPPAYDPEQQRGLPSAAASLKPASENLPACRVPELSFVLGDSATEAFASG